MGFGLWLFIITFAGTLLVQLWLKSTYGRFARVPNTSGLSGAEVAKAILRANGLHDVKVEAVQGMLSDHYDPRTRTVRLSVENYRNASVAGMAVAAHEVGHAIQHAQAYAPLQVRTALVPVASIGANFGPWLVIIGFLIGAMGLAQIGLILFGAAVLFQLVTLPIEFDASNRAMRQLTQMGLVTPNDSGGARMVLNAAAMTYVAALAASLAYLLYYLSIFLAHRD
jgi:Zn-dependent membrane protease YugP